jgi:hypothetical protein
VRRDRSRTRRRACGSGIKNICGGGWYFSASSARCAHRYAHAPETGASASGSASCARPADADPPEEGHDTPEPHRAIEGLSNDTDEQRVHERDIHWLCHGGFMDSTVSGGRLESTAGRPATVRNVTTVGRLVRKLSA